MVGSREGPSTGGETLTAVTVSSQGKQRSPECDQGLWVFLGQLHRDLCAENRKVVSCVQMISSFYFLSENSVKTCRLASQ